MPWRPRSGGPWREDCRTSRALLVSALGFSPWATAGAWLNARPATSAAARTQLAPGADEKKENSISKVLQARSPDSRTPQVVRSPDSCENLL